MTSPGLRNTDAVLVIVTGDAERPCRGGHAGAARNNGRGGRASQECQNVKAGDIGGRACIVGREPTSDVLASPHDNRRANGGTGA